MNEEEGISVEPEKASEIDNEQTPTSKDAPIDTVKEEAVQEEVKEVKEVSEEPKPEFAKEEVPDWLK
jgi:hypothetical protein